MGLDKTGRDYLTYRPIYGYTLLYAAKPFKEAIFEEYVPSKCIESLTNILPSSILREIASLLENLTVVQKRLEQCLQSQKANQITFTQYKNELDSTKPNYKLINQYENFQRTSLDGTIQGEVYRYVLDTRSEFEEYSKQLDKQLYKDKSKIPLEKKVDIDKQYVDNMIKKDASGALTQSDVTEIGVKIQLNHIALTRTLNAQDYVKGLTSVCSRTLNDKFNGNIVTVVQELSDTSLDNLKYFNHIGKVEFKKKTTKAENDRLHAMNMTSATVKSGMDGTLFNISNVVTDTRQPLLDWASSLDSDDDNGPTTSLIEEIIDRLTFMDEQHFNVVDASASMNRMDEISKNDLLETLRDKKTSRMLINMVDAMISEREKGTYNMDKFIQKNRLLEPGNMCTK